MDSQTPASRRRLQTQRLQLACEPCKTSKLKCDRRLPICDQCYRRSRESLCKYTERGLRYLASLQDVSALREKIGRVETIVERAHVCGSSDVISVTPSTGSLGHDARSYSAPAANDPAPAHIEQTGPGTGELKLKSGGSTKWVNASHWESMLEDIADVNSYLPSLDLAENQQCPLDDSPSSAVDGIPVIDPLFGASLSVTLDDLLKALPPREEMDGLIAGWFNAADPARVILHAPTFQAQYHDFWLDQHRTSPAWLALLLFTSTLGAEIVGQNLAESSNPAVAEGLTKLGTHALVLADASRPQPFVIEALVFYALTRLFRLHDTDSQTWQILGHTMRLCYQAGYHRDPSRNPGIRPFDCEMRRRVWMVVCELDVSVGSVLGTFSWRDPKVCDTDWPANLDDSDFSTTHMGAVRPAEDCTLVQTEICFSRLVQVQGEITASYHAIQGPLREEVSNFELRLHELREGLPQKLRMRPLEQSFIDPPSLIIDRIRLEFVYLKSLCVLYRRYLGDRKYPEERSRRIRASTSIVELCLSMLTLCRPGRQLAPLRVMIVRHIHDFTFAAMLLCAEYRQDEKMATFDPARSSAEVEFVDDLRPKLLEACQLWYLLGVPSAKAMVALRAVTSYLERRGLRSTATTASEMESTNPLVFTTNPLEMTSLESLEFLQEDIDSSAMFAQPPSSTSNEDPFAPLGAIQPDWFALATYNELAHLPTMSERPGLSQPEQSGRPGLPGRG